MAGEPVLMRVDLVKALRSVGLHPGDHVVVHSSYRSLGEVDGGPETVIDALLETIGPAGNLMLPTFNYTRPLPKPCYDPAVTPARTGIIAELGRRRPGAVRSLHPSHSVAVLGPDAAELVAGHLEHRAVGVGSPLDKLAQMGGKVLLLGVGHVSNSMIHIGEEHAGVPKASVWKEIPQVGVRLPDGTIVMHALDSSPSCSAAFGAVEYGLRSKGLICDGRLPSGKCFQAMRAADVIAVVCRMIAAKPDILLCTRPECRPCAGTRNAISGS
ncbi:MAG: AAC(3) family N-acetyltransferase [Kiritimatiellae bacterium]|nr:AAC(3) family N-acetyltransferase [Kiritimatiellia bacterium]